MEYVFHICIGSLYFPFCELPRHVVPILLLSWHILLIYGHYRGINLNSKYFLLICRKSVAFWFTAIFYYFRFYVFMCRERWREGEKHLHARETSIGCPLCAPSWGPGLHTSMCFAWNWNSQGQLSLCGTAPNPLSHASQDKIFLFLMSSILSIISIHDFSILIILAFIMLFNRTVKTFFPRSQRLFSVYSSILILI